MKKLYITTLLTTLLILGIFYGAFRLSSTNVAKENVKVGFVYVGDTSMAYTHNFIKAHDVLRQTYGDNVEIVAKYNVGENDASPALQELVDDGCDIIFSTSYGYSEETKEFAKQYPNIEFCQATGDNAADGGYVSNYHTFMGKIHQGRYLAGIAAGMKLQQLIDEGIITHDEAKIGYVAAYPYAEVISGYTAFFIGARSVLPDAQMTVIYTNTWSSYSKEKAAAAELIDDGCVIISQHSDTTGPAIACESTDRSETVFHIGYNQSMADVAPSTHIVSCRINWEPYIVGAVGAVMEGQPIEKSVKGYVFGNDMSGGLNHNWVEVLDVNDIVAAPGTRDRIASEAEKLRHGDMQVFKGPYIGVNPNDESDTIDLSNGYTECANRSAPSFNYVLSDIKIKR